MKRKYVRIFLMGLLCLIGNVELFSQYCLKMSYDKNGNRNYYKIYDCGKDMRDYANDIVEIDVCEKNETEMLVYPNPTNGKFIIENGDDMEYEMSLYDNKGVLINSKKIIGNVNVDITNNPAGAYLLRIIGNDNMRSVIVIKL